MIAYLVKSALCMVVLLGVFYVALEREKMHRFNRFYLLFSLCFALAIPMVEVETEIPQVVYTPLLTHVEFVEAAQPSNFVSATSPQSMEIPYLLLAYLIPSGLLFFRFGWHLYSIHSKIRGNNHLPIEGATVVLLDEVVQPHTFLGYIFMGKDEYHSKSMERELLTHELLHAKQRHTLDVLFVEILVVLLWFNPLVYLFRRAIKENHEFLADEFVVKSHCNVFNYQHILLSKVFQNNHQCLASNLTFSLTKKRLTMMTKNVSSVRVRAKQVVTVPLFLAIAVLLCVRVVAQPQQPVQKVAAPAKTKTEADSLRKLRDYFYKDVEISKNYVGEKSTRIKFKDLPESEKAKYWTPKPYKMKVPTEAQMTEWLDSTKYGLWVDGKRTRSNGVLKKYKSSDIAMYYVSFLYKNARKGKTYTHQLDVYTLPYFKKLDKEFWEKVRLSQLQ